MGTRSSSTERGRAAVEPDILAVLLHGHEEHREELLREVRAWQAGNGAHHLDSCASAVGEGRRRYVTTAARLRLDLGSWERCCASRATQELQTAWPTTGAGLGGLVSVELARAELARARTKSLKNLDFWIETWSGAINLIEFLDGAPEPVANLIHAAHQDLRESLVEGAERAGGRIALRMNRVGMSATAAVAFAQGLRESNLEQPRLMLLPQSITHRNTAVRLGCASGKVIASSRGRALIALPPGVGAALESSAVVLEESLSNQITALGAQRQTSWARLSLELSEQQERNPSEPGHDKLERIRTILHTSAQAALAAVSDRAKTSEPETQPVTVSR